MIESGKMYSLGGSVVAAAFLVLLVLSGRCSEPVPPGETQAYGSQRLNKY